MYKKMTNTEKTRQALMDAFWDIYCSKPIDKITIKEITDKAGYNRGTFYVYFKDVYDILDKIEEMILPDIHSDFCQCINQIDSTKLLPIFMEDYERKSKYLKVLLSKDGDPNFPSKFKSIVKPIIKSKIKEHYTIDELTLDYSLEYICSAILGTSTYWFQNDKNLPFETYMSLIQKFTLDGIFPLLIESNKLN